MPTSFQTAERRRRKFLVSQTRKIEKALNAIGTNPTEAKFRKMLLTVWTEVGLPFAKVEFNTLKSVYHDLQTKQEFDESEFIKELKKFLGANAATRITGMNDATKDIIKRILQEAADEGLGTEETARLLRDQLKLRNKVRARVIARTEITAASNFGAQQGAIMTGLKLLKEWIAANDSRTRDDHSSVDGQLRKLNKAFNVGGSAMQFPGDPSGPAEQVVNCRCTVAHVPI